MVADAFLHIAIVGASCIVFDLDYGVLAKAQAADEELHYIRQNLDALILSDMSARDGARPITCNTSNGISRLIVLLHFRRGVFESIYKLLNTGIEATQKTVTQCFLWPGMNKDVHQ